MRVNYPRPGQGGGTGGLPGCRHVRGKAQRDDNLGRWEIREETNIASHLLAPLEMDAR
jgi:hypothetical protein